MTRPHKVRMCAVWTGGAYYPNHAAVPRPYATPEAATRRLKRAPAGSKVVAGYFVPDTRTKLDYVWVWYDEHLDYLYFSITGRNRQVVEHLARHSIGSGARFKRGRAVRISFSKPKRRVK